VYLSHCKWGFNEALSCKGCPALCGPWNGYCSTRTAYLQDQGLQEPATPEDLRRRVPSEFANAADEIIREENARAERRRQRMRQDMERWKRRTARSQDFERER